MREREKRSQLTSLFLSSVRLRACAPLNKLILSKYFINCNLWSEDTMLLIGSAISSQLQKKSFWMKYDGAEPLRNVLQPLPPGRSYKHSPSKAVVSLQGEMQWAPRQSEVGEGHNATDPHTPLALHGFHKGLFTCINPVLSGRGDKNGKNLGSIYLKKVLLLNRQGEQEQ